MAILLAGSNAPLPVEHVFMPPFARSYSDDELAAAANFVNGLFGNGITKVTRATFSNADQRNDAIAEIRVLGTPTARDSG
jgi:hypothetical protein